MKKSALRVLALVALITAPAMASQGVGFNAGIDIASVSTTPALPAGVSTSSTKFLGGIFYEHGFDDMFGFIGEVDFRLTSTTWIAVPLMLKVAFNAGMVKPFLVIGPEVAFKIGGDTTPAALKSFDFAAVAGGGVAFDITPTIALHVLGRYELGFIDVSNTAGVSVKVRGIHILGGATFKL